MRAKLILLLLSSFILVLGQNGYQLNFKFKKNTKDSIDLSLYSGSSKKQYEIQSAPIVKRSASLNEETKLLGAIYRLSFNGANENDFINIAIDNGAKIQFELTKNDIKNLTTSDQKNQWFINAQNSTNLEERNQYYQKIIEQFPESVAALYAQLEIQKSQKLPNEKQTDSLKEIQKMFFANIDLNDNRIPLLPNIYSTLFDYIKIMPITNDNYIAAVDNLLKGQDCDSPNYMFYVKWLFMNLEYLNRYGMYDSFYHVFNEYLNRGKCIALNQEFYDRTVTALQNYEKVPVGSIIPDFKMVDENGEVHMASELYPIHDYTFIAFYDPDCGHCQKEMPRANDFINSMRANENIDVLPIAYLNAVSNYKWKTFIAENQLNNWFHVENKDPNLRYIIDLNVFANPAFFLVDKQGTILMKNFNPDEMRKIFEKK